MGMSVFRALFICLTCADQQHFFSIQCSHQICEYWCLQDTELHVLDLSHNLLTSAACAMLSSAMAKPQATRAWGQAGGGLGSRKDTGSSVSKRLLQTPAQGFNSCLQELNLSWNAIGTVLTSISTIVICRLLCLQDYGCAMSSTDFMLLHTVSKPLLKTSGVESQSL